jgi:hypothetical protein
MWAVSRKRICKYIAAERLILGNPLVTEHYFHGYENWKLKTRENQTVATKLTHVSAAMDKHRIIEESLFGSSRSYKLIRDSFIQS